MKNKLLENYEIECEEKTAHKNKDYLYGRILNHKGKEIEKKLEQDPSVVKFF